ncbi:P-loop containing nucleoside triphosphate hydrolase protein [Cantharellus anzutake]|uniref:P-loop containing nucleoside triphosphate hydrolase protein n=1 Tax=Cantharellus anzutake TaxID=1750568 RepID=UPI001904B2CB|nr:P-loop containing nucleoside triphosphate hydrolase protein [Cantharellus anzutake]KAF8322922.1 P-loop containing nucleoside triphosphate hydrolase protein [Cantharellus anzutake]
MPIPSQATWLQSPGGLQRTPMLQRIRQSPSSLAKHDELLRFPCMQKAKADATIFMKWAFPGLANTLVVIPATKLNDQQADEPLPRGIMIAGLMYSNTATHLSNRFWISKAFSFAAYPATDFTANWPAVSDKNLVQTSTPVDQHLASKVLNMLLCRETINSAEDGLITMIRHGNASTHWVFTANSPPPHRRVPTQTVGQSHPSAPNHPTAQSLHSYKLQGPLQHSTTTLQDAPMCNDTSSLASNGSSVLVYCNWLRQVDLIQSALKVNDINLESATSGDSVHVRDKTLNRFSSKQDRRGNPCHVLIISGVGTTGLNITTANVVIFADQLWSSQDERQVIGRVQRKGQTKKVTVVWLLADGTTDTLLYQFAQGKARQSETFVSKAKAFLALNNDEDSDGDTSDSGVDDRSPSIVQVKGKGTSHKRKRSNNVADKGKKQKTKGGFKGKEVAAPPALSPILYHHLQREKSHSL